MRAIGFAAAAVLGFVALAALPASAQQPAPNDDPPFLKIHGGGFDVVDDETTAEFGLAYRSDYKLWIFKPHFGALVTAEGGAMGYAGLLTDIYFGRRIVVTPSTSVGLWTNGNGKDLGNTVEFRSGLDIAYRFDDRSRLGMGIYHISNAGLGTRNPGEETVELFYSIPLTKLLAP